MPEFHKPIDVVYFSLPKIKESEEDIQDAYNISSDCTMVAIADGASSSLYPRQWAQLLVEEFCNYPNDSISPIQKDYENWLKPLQNKWFQYFKKNQNDPNIEWYLKGTQDKDCGSSTFVGLKLHYSDYPESQAHYECLAIGDSCLFHIKPSSSEIKPFPMEKSQDFSSVTDAFHSSCKYKISEPKFFESNYDKDDVFLLATDALAEWIFKDLEIKGKRWQQLLNFSNINEFTNFIEKLRVDKEIKNDDTTLIRLKIMSIPQKQRSYNIPSLQGNLEEKSTQPIQNKPDQKDNNILFLKPIQRLQKSLFFINLVILLISIMNFLIINKIQNHDLVELKLLLENNIKK